jgi:hypothetical protein
VVNYSLRPAGILEKILVKWYRLWAAASEEVWMIAGDGSWSALRALAPFAACQRVVQDCAGSLACKTKRTQEISLIQELRFSER